ncbi:hypothetical protein HYX05_00670 [Candidatus Woesearchaeota archaeon]|nr:hypothetical protein [Candidatus Woesearchaeota archaeon]
MELYNFFEGVNMSRNSRIAGVVFIPLAALGLGGAAYQDIICAERVAYHRFVKYARSQEGMERMMSELRKLRSSPKATTTQINNLEKALSSAPTINVAPLGWDCSPSVALGNENADDIFDEYLFGERSI